MTEGSSLSSPSSLPSSPSSPSPLPSLPSPCPPSSNPISFIVASIAWKALRCTTSSLSAGSPALYFLPGPFGGGAAAGPSPSSAASPPAPSSKPISFMVACARRMSGVGMTMQAAWAGGDGGGTEEGWSREGTGCLHGGKGVELGHVQPQLRVARFVHAMYAIGSRRARACRLRPAFSHAPGSLDVTSELLVWLGRDDPARALRTPVTATHITIRRAGREGARLESGALPHQPILLLELLPLHISSRIELLAR